MGCKIKEADREKLRDQIVVGAQKYRDKLINKDFLIICEDGASYDVRFFSGDFIHLTGVLSNLNSSRFFDNSEKNLLDTGNILEGQKYNWSTLKSKGNEIERIDEIIYGNTANSLFMINLHTNTGDYPVAIRNSDINTCVGFRDSIHRARTLRKFTNSGDADDSKKIIGILAKKPSEELYSELAYVSNIEELLKRKDDIKEIVDETIKSHFASPISCND